MSKRWEVIVFNDELADMYVKAAEELGVGVSRLMMIGANAVLTGEVEVKKSDTYLMRSTATNPLWLDGWSPEMMNALEVWEREKGEE